MEDIAAKDFNFGQSKTPYGELFYDAVQKAQTDEASDIHIEPTRTGISIRFRILGDMQPPWKKLSTDHKLGFVNEVKQLTNLSIAISGRPQDGRISIDPLKLDLRVNLLPTLYGEKIVLRLLDLKRNFDLDRAGFEVETLHDLKDATRFKNGVILISGPTGSGKTTTLYSLLCSIDRKKLNVITLEDPVEYSLPGINQVRIDSKINFSQALRAVLRQDPDVILVGEIRDEETAALCFKAASTGHLVLSTIHANGAAEVIGRLLNLGVEKFMIASNLRFSCAQRLVKRICQTCAVKCPQDVANDILKKAGVDLISRDGKSNFELADDGNGCSACRGGYTGRIPILEYMKGGAIKDFIEVAARDPPRLARTLKEAAYYHAFQGEIDIREVLNVS